MENEIVEKLAKKHNIPLKDAKNIIDSQFNSVKDCMENLKSIALPFFGKFIPNINAYNRKQEKNRLEKEQQELLLEDEIDEIELDTDIDYEQEDEE